jgi:ATP-dependent Clp protease ATP-binding subunit ClpA
MPDIALKDILINARQESFRMQHYYLGVEHLFIGLLEIQGGLTSSIIEAQGLTTEYVIDAIRQTGAPPANDYGQAPNSARRCRGHRQRSGARRQSRRNRARFTAGDLERTTACRFVSCATWGWI